MSLWTQQLDNDELNRQCVSVLRGDAPAEVYLQNLAVICLGQLEQLHQGDWPIAGYRFTSDELLDVGALSVTRDATVDINMRFLREMSSSALAYAWELAETFNLSYFGPDSGPASYMSADQFLDAVLSSEESRLSEDRFTYSYSERLIGSLAQLADGLWPSLATPVISVRDLPRDFYKSGTDPELYAADNPAAASSAYILRLYHHVALSALLYGLCHELGHVALDHLDEPASATDQRSREIAADLFALRRLAARADVDLRPSVAVFRFLRSRESEASRLPSGSVTHPYSTERLQALAGAVAEARVERILPEVNETLRSLRYPLPPISSTEPDGTVEVSLATFSDLTSAYVDGLVDSKSGDSPGISVDCHVVFHTIDSPSRPRASSRVSGVLEPVDIQSVWAWDMAVADGRSTQPPASLQLRIVAPPLWRLKWPHGMLRLATVVPSESVAGTTRWDGPKESLAPLTPLMDAVQTGRIRAREVRDWAAWCFAQGWTSEGTELNTAAVFLSPSDAGYEAVMLEIAQQCQTSGVGSAAEIASRYMAEAGIARPGLHLVCGEAAFENGQYLRAMDAAFLELCSFRQDSKYAARAGELQALSLNALRDTEFGAAVSSYYAEFNNRRRFEPRRRTARRLRKALTRLDTASDMAKQSATYLQLRGEGLCRVGELAVDREATQAAEQTLRTLTQLVPVFGPAWVHLGHALLDLGQAHEAMDCLIKAEALTPMSPVVGGLRSRIKHLRKGA